VPSFWRYTTSFIRQCEISQGSPCAKKQLNLFSWFDTILVCDGQTKTVPYHIPFYAYVLYTSHAIRWYMDRNIVRISTVYVKNHFIYSSSRNVQCNRTKLSDVVITLSNASPGASSRPLPIRRKSSTDRTMASKQWPPLTNSTRNGNSTLPFQHNNHSSTNNYY